MYLITCLSTDLGCWPQAGSMTAEKLKMHFSASLTCKLQSSVELSSASAAMTFDVQNENRMRNREQPRWWSPSLGRPRHVANKHYRPSAGRFSASISALCHEDGKVPFSCQHPALSSPFRIRCKYIFSDIAISSYEGRSKNP